MSSQLFESLRKESESRVITDRHLSPAWVLLPILEVLGAIIITGFVTFAALAAVRAGGTPASMAGLFGSLGALLLVPLGLGLAYLYFLYLLIQRRNQHFARERGFFTTLVAVLRQAAAKKGVNVDAYLASMEGTSRQAQLDESEKSAILWVVLLIVPLVNIISILYIFYFLTKDFYVHERREDSMLADTERALSSMGVQLVFNRTDPIPQRSFVLYLIVSILTAGLFELYWVYVLIVDPNVHFRNHITFEDSILQLVVPLAL